MYAAHGRCACQARLAAWHRPGASCSEQHRQGRGSSLPPPAACCDWEHSSSPSTAQPHPSQASPADHSTSPARLDEALEKRGVPRLRHLLRTVLEQYLRYGTAAQRLRWQRCPTAAGSGPPGGTRGEEGGEDRQGPAAAAVQLLTGRSRSAAAACCSRGLTSGASASLSSRHSCCTHLQAGGRDKGRRYGYGRRYDRASITARWAGPAPPTPSIAKSSIAKSIETRTDQGDTCTAARRQLPASCPWCP